MSKNFFFIDDAKTFGGAQVALLNSISALNKSGGCTVKIMVAKENRELISRLGSLKNISIQYCPGALPVNIFTFIFNIFWFAKFFYKNNDKDKFIFVANLSGLEFCIAPVIVLKLYGFNIHGWLHNASRLNDLMPNVSFLKKKQYLIRDKIAEKIVSRMYDAFLTPTKAAANLLQERIGYKKNINNIFNVLKNKPNLFPENIAKSLELKNNIINIAIIGRIEFSTKGQDKSIALVQEFSRIGVSVAINIVGDGPDRFLLEKMFRDHGLSASLKILGWQKDVTSFIDSSDVVWVPSRHESFSLVVAEAMSRMKPLVSSNLPCFKELLPDKFICQTDSISEYVDKILKVVNIDSGQLQSEYRKSLRMCSEENFVKKFTSIVSNKFDGN